MSDERKYQGIEPDEISRLLADEQSENPSDTSELGWRIVERMRRRAAERRLSLHSMLLDIATLDVMIGKLQAESAQGNTASEVSLDQLTIFRNSCLNVFDDAVRAAVDERIRALSPGLSTATVELGSAEVAGEAFLLVSRARSGLRVTLSGTTLEIKVKHLDQWECYLALHEPPAEIKPATEEEETRKHRLEAIAGYRLLDGFCRGHWGTELLQALADVVEMIEVHHLEAIEADPRANEHETKLRSLHQMIRRALGDKSYGFWSPWIEAILILPTETKHVKKSKKDVPDTRQNRLKTRMDGNSGADSTFEMARRLRRLADIPGPRSFNYESFQQLQTEEDCMPNEGQVTRLEWAVSTLWPGADVSGVADEDLIARLAMEIPRHYLVTCHGRHGDIQRVLTLKMESDGTPESRRIVIAWEPESDSSLLPTKQLARLGFGPDKPPATR